MVVNGRVNDMVNRHGKPRSKPPSRIRYENSHPTVSFRIDRELYDELKDLKSKSGLSVADILRVGMEKCLPLVGEAFHKGTWEGFGESLLVVCDDCKEELLDKSAEWLPYDSKFNTDVQ